jgi:cation diffusion facilitator family transporter
MHPTSSQHDLSRWQREHHFDSGNPAAERGTRRVMWITLAVMAIEITAGWWYNSMALLADGWHMGSHALAIGLTALAYATARKYASDPRFAFGSWKIEVLAGFTSALSLIGVAVLMLFESAARLLEPQTIHYREAIVVAVLGLLINLVCALILNRAGHAHHAHGHDHEQVEGHLSTDAHGDLNLRAAYLHVLADAATSVLAILALFGGLIFGWGWLDPLIGVAGALLIGSWAIGLLHNSARILLDREMDHPLVDTIRTRVQALEPPQNSQEGLHITDLHLWRIGRDSFACVLTLATHRDEVDVNAVREALASLTRVAHLTVEIHHCPQGSHRFTAG